MHNYASGRRSLDNQHLSAGTKYGAKDLATAELVLSPSQGFFCCALVFILYKQDSQIGSD